MIVQKYKNYGNIFETTVFMLTLNIEIVFVDIKTNPSLPENSLILYTKFFIYRQRCMKKSLSYGLLRAFILEQIQVKECIAKNKNKLSQHLVKWETISL